MLFDFHELPVNKLPILSVFPEASLIIIESKVSNLSGLVVQYGGAGSLLALVRTDILLLQSNFIKFGGTQLHQAVLCTLH